MNRGLISSFIVFSAVSSVAFGYSGRINSIIPADQAILYTDDVDFLIAAEGRAEVEDEACSFRLTAVIRDGAGNLVHTAHEHRAVPPDGNWYLLVLDFTLYDLYGGYYTVDVTVEYTVGVEPPTYVDYLFTTIVVIPQ